MDSYNDLVRSKKVVMVEFYADWCPHCQRMMPVIDELKELLDGRSDVYQLNVDRNERLMNALEVTGTPTFIIYSDGGEVWRHSGEIDGNVLLEKVQSFLS